MILPRRIALSLMLTVLGSFGCAHAPASSTAAAAEPMPDAYDGAERLELEASAPAPVVADADYGSDDVAQKKHAELAAPGPRTTAPEEASGGTGETPAVAAPDLEPSDRYLVYTANMTISVFDRDRALRDAERLPDRFGGYVSQLGDEFLVLRIPAGRLRSAMDDLARLGVVESRSLQAQEVTAEFVDLQSRIRALEETQAQLLALLGKARTVEEALHVRGTLDRINGELEVLKGRLRQLGNLVAYSTLHVRLIERGPHDTIPTSNDPFPWVDRLGVEATEWN